MSHKKSAGGRPIGPFIIAHFTQGGRKEGNSNQWLFSCNYCQESLEHRENRLLSHLRDLKKCKQAPPDVRQKARVWLAQKGGIINSKDDLFPPENSTVIADASGDTEGLAQTVADNPSKKRKSEGNIKQYIEKQLSQSEIDKHNVRLLRYVIIMVN